jgi:hypothetical protein
MVDPFVRVIFYTGNEFVSKTDRTFVRKIPWANTIKEDWHISAIFGGSLKYPFKMDRYAQSGYLTNGVSRRAEKAGRIKYQPILNRCYLKKTPGNGHWLQLFSLLASFNCNKYFFGLVVA